MLRFPLLLALSLGVLCTTGCDRSGEPYDPAMQRYTLEFGGLVREYFVFLPSSYDGEKAHPVAIFMHGYGGTATGTEAEVTQGLNQYAEEYGYVVVYPQGTWFMGSVGDSEPWEVTSWNHLSGNYDDGPDGPLCTSDAARVPCPPECGSCGQCGWTSCHDDIGFLKTLAGVVSSDFAVDARRTYVAGFSNGAMMANRLACEAADLFAAAALVGGRLEPGYECTPARRIPLLQISGGADEVVPHDGRVSSSGWFYATPSSVASQWHQGEVCAGEPAEDWTSPTIEDENVQCTVGCGDTVHPSIDCLWPEGNHRWPGTPSKRGSDGYCVTELQAASMPDQTICIAPEEETDFWGSRLMFEFFDDTFYTPGEE